MSLDDGHMKEKEKLGRTLGADVTSVMTTKDDQALYAHMRPKCCHYVVTHCTIEKRSDD